MGFVDEWHTPQRDKLELWADMKAGDGHLVAVGPNGTEVAADLIIGDGTTEVTWRGTLADRSPYWQAKQADEVRARLAGERS